MGRVLLSERGSADTSELLQAARGGRELLGRGGTDVEAARYNPGDGDIQRGPEAQPGINTSEPDVSG